MVRSIDIEKILEFGTRYVTNRQTADLEDEALAWLVHHNIFGKQAMLKMGESSGPASGGKTSGEDNPPVGGGEPADGGGDSEGTGGEGPAGEPGQAGDGTENSGDSKGEPGAPPGIEDPQVEEQIEYDTARAGLQAVPYAKTFPYDATDPTGQSEIKGSPVMWGIIRKKIIDTWEYRNKKGDGGFRADADLLKEAVKNRENNQWLQQNKEKVNLALQRIFEYGATQWATEGFRITDPAIIRSRVQKLYDAALMNGRLDARDLDLVYSRFTRQLGLPDREVIIDPVTAKNVTVRNPTTFQIFQNWMNSPEVPWWHKAALIIGVPLAFAGLVTKMAGGSTGASAFLGGSGIFLSGLGGLLAYTGARGVESKRRIEQAARLQELRREQDKYDALDAPYSSFGPEGKDFFDQFFNQKDGKPLITDPQDIFPTGIINAETIEKFLNLAGTPEKRAEAERILFTLDAIHKFRSFKLLKDEYLPEVAQLEAILMDKLHKLQKGGNISFGEISYDFRNLLNALPSDMKGQILGEMGYDPASIQMFKYLENLGSREEDVYNADKKSGSVLTDLILGYASPEELLQAVDQANRNIIIRDATILPRRELDRTPNRNLGVLIGRNSWAMEDKYNDEVIMQSIINAMKDSEVTYSDLAFLNSLAMNAEYKSTWFAERPPQTRAENKEQAQARLAGDILNAGLIPPISKESDPGTYEAIYGKNTAYLSVPTGSLKTFIQIARNNMDYVLENNTYKSLAGLMIHDLYKHQDDSYSIKYIDDVVNSSPIPQTRKGVVANELKQLAKKDPAAAVLALGLFNPALREQMKDEEIQPQILNSSRLLAADTIKRIAGL